MRQIIAIIDRTIDEALRLGIKLSELMPAVKILKKYWVHLIDISMENIEFVDVDIFDEELKRLLRCKVDASKEEIMKADDLGFCKLAIKWVHKGEKDLNNLISMITLAKKLNKDVDILIENASVVSLDNLEIYCELVKSMSISRLIFCDRDGELTPLTALKIFEKIQQKDICTIEFHSNNIFGLATANSLAAIRGGIKYIGASVGGVGVPPSASLEEVLMSMKYLWSIEEIPSGERMAYDCGMILGIVNIEIPVDKPIVGSYIFAHESGIHVDGIYKNPALYEVIKPEDVGSERKLIIGKHSGTASIRAKFSQWNMYLSQDELTLVLEKVRDLAEKQKGSLSDEQLRNIYINEIINNTNKGIAN